MAVATNAVLATQVARLGFAETPLLRTAFLDGESRGWIGGMRSVTVRADDRTSLHVGGTGTGPDVVSCRDASTTSSATGCAPWNAGLG